MLLGAYNKSDAFWMSATDLGVENSFYWDSNGKFLSLHTDWAENQPDNFNDDEHCVSMGINTSETYLWSDIDCKATSRYLCEEKVSHVLILNEIKTILILKWIHYGKSI